MAEPGAPVVCRPETSHTVAVPEEPQVGTTRTVRVEVQGDHLQALGRARDPISAIAELVWNGLDEDATDVRVQLVSNNLDGLETIRVIDNGNGMPYDEGVRAFGSLGGSSKRQRVRTPGGRLRHGKLGKGRFRAFALGDRIGVLEGGRLEGIFPRKEFAAAGSPFARALLATLPEGVTLT